MKQLLNLTLKSVALMLMAFAIGAYTAVACGVPDLAIASGASLVVAGAFMPQLNGSLGFITASAVVAEWGALYREQGQGVKDIMTRLMQKTVTAKYFPQRITEQTIMEKVDAKTTSVLQRFQKAFTPKGGVTFEPLKIPLTKVKIDLSEYPDELEESWLGFLASNNLDRKTWPFIKWYLYEMGFKQLDKDRENNEIYKGVQGTITAGTATADGATLNGIKKQINTLNTAGKLNLITMGAMPTAAADVVDYIEDMIKATDRLLRNELDYVFVNEDVHDLFRDGMRTKYNAQYRDVDDDKLTKMRNDNIRVVGLPSMAGSNKVWFTPEWNRQSGLKKPKNPTIFQVENVDRLVKAYSDWYEGYGFWIGEYVTSNDVELT